MRCSSMEEELDKYVERNEEEIWLPHCFFFFFIWYLHTLWYQEEEEDGASSLLQINK